MQDDKNPILYYIGETPIRKKNQISVCLSEQEMSRIAHVVINTGLSIPKIYALQGQPCQNCGKSNIEIPKGLLSTKREHKGGNINNRKKKDDINT